MAEKGADDKEVFKQPEIPRRYGEAELLEYLLQIERERITKELREMSDVIFMREWRRMRHIKAAQQKVRQ